jgi:hypothetical protein
MDDSRQRVTCAFNPCNAMFGKLFGAFCVGRTSTVLANLRPAMCLPAPYSSSS